MANYQHASDAMEGMPPFSGVIRSDGRWCPNDHHNEDWQEYLKWAADGKNHPDPYKKPADGGVVIKLQEDEEAVGAMLDSMPPPEEPKPAPSPAPPPTTGSAAPVKK